jgi:hypothetical protein
MTRDGLRLSAELLNRCAAVFDRHPRYSVADQAIKKMLAVFPSNSYLPDVIAKVGLIKTLYATPIYDVFGIAERICAYREFDSLIANGDPKAVEVIRHGHQIKNRSTGKEWDFYSFATKYCSFHNPALYPIYDNMVAGLLLELNHEHAWDAAMRRRDLQDYPSYRRLVDAVASFSGLSSASYKDLDKGLRILAKYRSLVDKAPTARDDAWIVGEVDSVVKTQ